MYVQFRDEAGNISDTAQASIEYVLFSGPVTLAFNPLPAHIYGIEDTALVDVVITGADNLISSRFTVSFDTAIVEVIEIITDGEGFLLTDAGAQVIVSDNIYNNSLGIIVVGVLGQASGFTGATGDGVLARITFKGIGEGISPLTFVDVEPDDIVIYKHAENEQGFGEQPVELITGTIEVHPGSIQP